MSMYGLNYIVLKIKKSKLGELIAMAISYELNISNIPQSFDQNQMISSIIVRFVMIKLQLISFQNLVTKLLTYRKDSTVGSLKQSDASPIMATTLSSMLSKKC